MSNAALYAAFSELNIMLGQGKWDVLFCRSIVEVKLVYQLLNTYIYISIKKKQKGCNHFKPIILDELLEDF